MFLRFQFLCIQSCVVKELTRVVVQKTNLVGWVMEIAIGITSVLVHWFVEVTVVETLTTVLGEMETTAA